MNLVDMDEPVSTTPKLAGMPRYGYITKISDILVEAKVIPSPVSLADKVTISTAHTNKTGKKFTKLYCVKNKGMQETKSVGDMKMLEADSDIKYFYPSDDATARGYVEEVLGADCMILQPNLSESLILQFGEGKSPLMLKSFRMTWGGKAGDEYGVELTFNCSGVIPRVYTAAIPLTVGA